jgi:pilus assembly protein CpaC
MRLPASAGALAIVTGVLLSAAAPAQEGSGGQSAAQEPPGTAARELSVTVGKSVIVDSAANVERVSVANGELAEAVVVSPREILINGKAPGETSLVIWQQGGSRQFFDLRVYPGTLKIEAIRRELEKELAGQGVSLTMEDNNVFLRGTVNDLVSAERAVAIASALGKPINLLHVKVPPVDPQVLIKVRFADVDRGATHELGANFFSTGALNTPASVTVGTFSPPRLEATGTGGTATVTLTDALNLFLFRPDLNLGTTIRALESKRFLQILAEPNLLTLNGKSASFLAGGEFPYPTLQGGGGGLGAVTIQFREFGVRISFVPTVTPRGTIHMQVTPEVSSLDFANGLTFQGFTIPGLNTRRVQTEVELESGQSFAIGGLLDNRLTESLAKIPGLSSIPVLGKLFQTRIQNKSNSELLVLVTPEVVRPIPAGHSLPELKMPGEFLKDGATTAPRTPGLEATGPVPIKPPQETLPVEKLMESQKTAPAAPVPAGVVPVPIQFAPVPVAPPAQPAAPKPPGN